MPLAASVNVTVPVGPVPPVTVAVNVVASFGLEAKLGLTLEASTVVVEVLETESVRMRSQLVKETMPSSSSTRKSFQVWLGVSPVKTLANVAEPTVAGVLAPCAWPPAGGAEDGY